MFCRSSYSNLWMYNKSSFLFAHLKSSNHYQPLFRNTLCLALTSIIWAMVKNGHWKFGQASRDTDARGDLPDEFCVTKHREVPWVPKKPRKDGHMRSVLNNVSWKWDWVPWCPFTMHNGKTRCMDLLSKPENLVIIWFIEFYWYLFSFLVSWWVCPPSPQIKNCCWLLLMYMYRSIYFIHIYNNNNNIYIYIFLFIYLWSPRPRTPANCDINSQYATFFYNASVRSQGISRVFADSWMTDSRRKPPKNGDFYSSTFPHGDEQEGAHGTLAMPQGSIKSVGGSFWVFPYECSNMLFHNTFHNVSCWCVGVWMVNVIEPTWI